MLSICIRCRLQVVPFWQKKVFFFKIRTKNFKTRDMGLLTFPAAAISHSFWLVKCDSMRLIIDIGISRSAPTSPFNFSASVDSIISFLHANQWSATWFMHGLSEWHVFQIQSRYIRLNLFENGANSYHFLCWSFRIWIHHNLICDDTGSYQGQFQSSGGILHCF